MNPMKAIREKCLDCSCQQPVEVMARLNKEGEA